MNLKKIAALALTGTLLFSLPAFAHSESGNAPGHGGTARLNSSVEGNSDCYRGHRGRGYRDGTENRMRGDTERRYSGSRGERTDDGYHGRNMKYGKDAPHASYRGRYAEHDICDGDHMTNLDRNGGRHYYGRRHSMMNEDGIRPTKVRGERDGAPRDGSGPGTGYKDGFHRNRDK